MVPLTVEQCREALVRLREYAHWMYYRPEGMDTFKKNSRTYNGRTFSVQIEEDGRLAAILADNGVKVLFDVVIMTGPIQPAGSLDNVDHRVRVANADLLTREDLAYANEIRVFAQSFFQRAVAFQFLARMADETVAGLANGLASAV